MRCDDGFGRCVHDVGPAARLAVFDGESTVPIDAVHMKLEPAFLLAVFEPEVLVPIDYDKAAAAIAGKCVFQESKRALNFPKDDEKTREERDEKKEKEEDQERNEVSASALVPQETMEQGSNKVIGGMVNILVQGLDGRHLNMKVERSTRVSALCEVLSKMTGIPMDAFYLTRQTKVLQDDEELWPEQDERVCMRGRLRGGMDGDWTCQHCGRQGCWVTKVRCYRCGKSKYDPPNQQPMDGNTPGWIRSQARQQTEREWAQATRGAGVGSGTGGQPLGQKPPPPPPQQQNQRPQNQRQKAQAQSRAPSPVQEEESYEVLLAALNGLIPSSLLEQVRSSLPKPEKPLTERMMQGQSKLEEAVKLREAALVDGRKILAHHMTKVEGLQAELSELETQFITQRREKEEQERKDEREKLAATQVEQVPIPEDVDMEDGPGGKKRRGVPVEAMSCEEIEATILRSMDALGTKPEDYAEMIQRCLAKKAQQRAECGESSKVSRLDVQENGNQEEDMNL